ncbi:PAS domain-containing protein [Flectobacillus major]|uniref:PAS domain-containing protein n=1 Tax=Flectobacillus major TaxID=103 RepID=UPI0009DBE994|nr:PAS domain-containing protein [Flectobacillus major]
MCLSTKSSCDTFVEVNRTFPLMIGLEFMRRPAKLREDILLEYDCIVKKYKTYHWNFDLYSFREFIQNPSHAIVITDIHQKIQWVNNGFVSMTGYQAIEALDKTPKFLQGKETRQDVRNQIRQSIAAQKTFSGEIINYRKNGEAYLCYVTIEPIFNRDNQLVNFIAFEEAIEV